MLHGGSRHFKTGGHGISSSEFDGSGDCFDTPLHIPGTLRFLMRAEKKI